VERTAFDLRVRQAAKVKVSDEAAALIVVPPFDAGLLVDVLKRPEEPPHRVDGLIPNEAGTLVVAARKTGKTTFELNLARCLITGEAFLDTFETIAVEGRVALLNFEVSGAQLTRRRAARGPPRCPAGCGGRDSASSPLSRSSWTRSAGRSPAPVKTTLAR
jgi:hypothetical protein